MFADIGVYPEHLVQDDDGGSRQDLRPRDIGAKRAVPAFYGDAILHFALRGRSCAKAGPLKACAACIASSGVLRAASRYQRRLTCLIRRSGGGLFDEAVAVSFG